MKAQGCLKFVAIFIGIVIVLLLILIGVTMVVISDVALNIINEKVPAELNTAFHLDTFKLRLLRGYVGLGGLHVGQPEGYGTNALLDLDKLDVKVSLKSLRSNQIIVRSIRLQSATINLIKTSNGVMNVEAIVPVDEKAPKTASGIGTNAVDIKTTEKPAKNAEKSDMTVLIKKVILAGCQVSYTDHTLCQPPLQVVLDDIDITLSDLLVDPNAVAESIKPALLSITARMKQPKKEDALIGGSAHIGPVGGDIPNVNAVLIISGTELSTFGTLIPPGVPAALGGNAFDLGVKLALATNILSCNLKLDMIAGNTHNLRISGTPDAPVVEKSGVLFGVITRFGGGLGHAVGNVGSAGMDIAGTAVGTVGNVGKGAGKAVGTFGKGLLQTAKGVVTADLQDIKEGATKSTVGTVSETANTVTDTGKGIVNGVSEAGSSSMGGKTAKQWRENTSKRWEKEYNKAQEMVEMMPFPPQQPAKKPLD